MRRAIFGALALVSAALMAGPTLAGPKDYRFEAATPEVAMSTAASIQVRLVHVPTGKPVADAILLPAQMEMPMQGAATPMTAKATLKGGDGKGIYELTANLSMTGTWRLKLAAKAQSVSETITATIPIVVVNGLDHNSHH